MISPSAVITMLAIFAFLSVPGSTGQPIEGATWTLLEIEGEMIAGDAPQGPPTLTLDAESGRASGTGGCNNFSGGYTLDGEKIEFTPVAATMMACPEGMDAEYAFFAALGETRTWAIVDEHLELYDAEGALLARLEPSERP